MKNCSNKRFLNPLTQQFPTCHFVIQSGIIYIKFMVKYSLRVINRVARSGIVGTLEEIKLLVYEMDKVLVYTILKCFTYQLERNRY